LLSSDDDCTKKQTPQSSVSSEGCRLPLSLERVMGFPTKVP